MEYDIIAEQTFSALSVILWAINIVQFNNSPLVPI